MSIFSGTYEPSAYFSPVPKGIVLHLLTGMPNDLLKATDMLSKDLFNKVRNPAFALIVSCAGRFAYLQKDIPKEQEIIKKQFKDAPFIGFYGYSEQSTLPGGTCGSFCQTIVGLTMSDDLAV